MLRLLALLRPVGSLTRNVSTLQRNTSKKRLLMARLVDTGRMNMSGHGPDISKLQATIAIIIGGGSFVAFGMYQTMSMRDRIEAFETGKVIPFKSLTDDELLVFRKKFKELHGEEEEEEEEEKQEEEEQESEKPASNDDDQEQSEIEPETPALNDDQEPGESEPEKLASNDDDQELTQIEPGQDEDLTIPREIQKSSKDTVIFIDAPED